MTEMVAERLEGRMRLTLLGGFLGSGKTTWLRHQLHERRFADAFVIVNEAAETPVDNALLAGSAVLAGGCACCDGLSGLLAMLRDLCDQRVGAGASFNEIVLETSGLADPGPIVAAIRADPVLVHHLVIGEIIVAVDAVYGLQQLREEPLSRRQIELADRLIVTKTDAADNETVARLVATLGALNPGAVIEGAVKGSASALPDSAGVAPEELASESGGEDRRPIQALKLDLGEDIDWTAFSVWLSALIHARGDDILRVKGVVRTPAGRLLLQSVRRIVQSPEIVPESSAAQDNNLVFIGRGFGVAQLSRSLRHFAGVERRE